MAAACASSACLEVPNDSDCAICLGRVACLRNKYVVTQLACRHVYHSFCLRQWFTRADSCPLCKQVPEVWPYPDIPRPSPPTEDEFMEYEDEEEEEEEFEDEVVEDVSEPESAEFDPSAPEQEDEVVSWSDDDSSDALFDMDQELADEIVGYAERLERDDSVSRIERTLDTGVPIGDHNAVTLFRALSTNTRLQHMALVNQNMTNFSINVLATVLARNKGLRFLNLGSNEFDEDGVIALARALRRNKRLTHLILDGTRVGDSGMRELCNALVSNTTLEHISLRGTGLTNESMRMVNLLANSNRTLRYLCVAGNQRLSGAACLATKTLFEARAPGASFVSDF